MLTTGDIANWAAAGFVFPLMFLPLAALLARRSAVGGALLWVALVGAATGAGLLFVSLAPRMTRPPLESAGTVFAACVGALALVIALAGGPARATASLARGFDWIARTVGRGVMWLLLAMALLQFAIVILRYVFGLNFIFMQEGVTYMHGAVFLLAAGYALATGDHVRVDILYRAASTRRKALVDFVGTYVFLFPVVLVILWTASPYVGESFSVREGSTEQSGIQAIYLLKAMIPAFAILVAMAGFALAARAGETLRGAR
jgi:TRAP-type mannitol/chloroaromatic compound transport system permease small subunit